MWQKCEKFKYNFYFDETMKNKTNDRLIALRGVLDIVRTQPLSDLSTLAYRISVLFGISVLYGKFLEI